MTGGRAILVVEDHAESRRSLAYVLEQRGDAVHQAANGRAALALARRETLHAAVLDLKLPDMEGLSVLEGLLEASPGLPVVVVTGFGTIDTAVEAMKRGAAEFLTKPLDVDRLLVLLDRSVARARNEGTVPTPTTQASAEMLKVGLVGASRPMRELFDQVKRIAPHYSTVLVVGESGTGKELVARALHELGRRSSGPFVAVNCATLSDHILESELFGHEKGAFTSADQSKPGVMELADRGTLFLDEVNEMGLRSQAKLLRALERREFRRVGGTRKIRVNLSIVAASNANLEEWVSAGRFRHDLYYRLKVLTLVVPPLRERKEAIPVLAEKFLSDVASRIGMPAKRLSPEALAQLVRYDWPGNVRELQNAMESLALMGAGGPVVGVDDLPPNVRGAREGVVEIAVGTRLADAEKELIRRTLDATPTIREAARVLGIGLRTLHTKIGAYGLRKR